MRSKFTYVLFYGAAMLLFILACRKKEKILEVEKEVIVYKETEHKWNRVAIFESNNAEFIRNAKRVGERFIYFAANSSNVVYDSVFDKFSTLSGWQRDLQLKPLITDAFKLVLIDNVINVVPHNNLPGHPIAHSEGLIQMDKYDSLFVRFNLGLPAFEGEITGNSNVILFAYRAKNSAMNYMAAKLKFVPQPINSGPSLVEIQKVKIIKDFSTLSSNRFLGKVGKNLMFMMGGQKNYVLDSNLDTVFVNKNYSFSDVFSYRNSCFAIARKYDQNCLVTTIDDGFTWQELFCGLDYDFTGYNFEPIGDKLIVSFSNRLFEANIAADNITIKELDNDGLANKNIKAITMSNNRVFISTESGVFERPYTEFIDYK